MDSSSPIRTAACLLGISPDQIRSFTPDHSGGLNNHLYRFEAGTESYYLRIPTLTSSRFSNPRNEIALYEALEGHGISDRIVRIEPQTGIKLSFAEKNARTLNPADPNEFGAALSAVRALHTIQAPALKCEPILERTHRFLEIAKSCGAVPENSVFFTLSELSKFAPAMNERPRATVHGDLLPGNVLVRPDGTIRLIDFEFAACADPLEDFASLFLHLSPRSEPPEIYLRRCFQREPTKQEICLLFVYAKLAALGWQLWALTKIHNGEHSSLLDTYAQLMNEFVSTVQIPAIPDDFLWRSETT